MCIAGENIGDRQILHDDHRREVHERDARFVVILQSSISVGRLSETARGEEHEPMAALFERLKQPVRKLPCAVEGHNSKEGGEEFRKHMVGGDVTRLLAPELAMLTGQRQPGTGLWHKPAPAK